MSLTSVGPINRSPRSEERHPLTWRLRDDGAPVWLDEYRGKNGYRAAEQALKQAPDDLVNQVKDAGLKGRGGAGFPTGVKWSLMPKDESLNIRYLLCNADEMEPNTWKDRLLMEQLPHLLVEGMLISAHALKAYRGYIFLRGEYVEAAHHLNRAIAEATEAGLLGKNILGSGFDFELFVHTGAGRYICGEETALLESLEGKKGQPRFKPPFPASFGLYGRPTTINNTETFAAVPFVFQMGAQAYLELGIEKAGGTKIFSVSGDVERPGNYEIPLGTPFSKLLELAGGVKGGRALKAVIPGGSSSPVLPADIMMNTNMDYDSIAKAGSMLGSGAVIVLDDTRCMVKSLMRLSYFYMEESCGQCTPCREGTGWLYRMMQRMEHGQGTMEDIETLDSVAHNMMGRTICALADAAAMPVRSFIKHFRDEFVHHVDHKDCVVAKYL
jgi:NADH-quinone oxidoreductase subunit F